MRWDVVGWRLAKRSIVLDKEVRDTNGQKPTYHKKIVARIGTTPLPFPKFNETTLKFRFGEARNELVVGAPGRAHGLGG